MDVKKRQRVLSYVSLQKLQRLYKQEQNMKAKLRLLAAIRRKKGESIDDIAQALEKPRRTIHGWLHRFEKRRINGAYDKKQPGRTPWLNKAELKKLRRELIKGPPYGGVWTTKILGDHIERKYDVKYSYDNVYRLVCALGFSIQKARPEHYKTDKSAQEQFKKKQGASHGSIVIADGRSHASMNVPSTSRLTSQEAGRSKEADPS